jgi:hypothetical protein
MATPRYLPVATFKTWWKTEISAEDSLVEAAINAAELAIDNATGRKMIVVTSGAPGLTTRVYRPASCGSDVLWLDDFTELSALTENGSPLTSGTDFVLEPLNNLSTAGETVPYDRAIRYGRSWYVDPPKATVSVTARFGWAAIPYEVIESCKIIAADMLSNRDMRNGLVAITEAGGVGSRENLTVRNMIAKYRSSRSWGVA